eukprot:jgi/Botrbrau1/6669/Bobra.0202s0017.1
MSLAKLHTGLANACTVCIWRLQFASRRHQISERSNICTCSPTHMHESSCLYVCTFKTNIYLFYVFVQVHKHKSSCLCQMISEGYNLEVKCIRWEQTFCRSRHTCVLLWYVLENRGYYNVFGGTP